MHLKNLIEGFLNRTTVYGLVFFGGVHQRQSAHPITKTCRICWSKVCTLLTGHIQNGGWSGHKLRYRTLKYSSGQIELVSLRHMLTAINNLKFSSGPTDNMQDITAIVGFFYDIMLWRNFVHSP